MICTILNVEEETNRQRRLLRNIASDQIYRPHYQVQRHCAIGSFCNKSELLLIYLEESLHLIVRVLRIFLFILAIRCCISSCVILSHSSCSASFVSSSESKILRRKRCWPKMSSKPVQAKVLPGNIRLIYCIRQAWCWTIHSLCLHSEYNLRGRVTAESS
jgi:hypothetical protein